MPAGIQQARSRADAAVDKTLANSPKMLKQPTKARDLTENKTRGDFRCIEFTFDF